MQRRMSHGERNDLGNCTSHSVGLPTLFVSAPADVQAEAPRRFIIDVEETMRLVLEQEDTDGNFQVRHTLSLYCGFVGGMLIVLRTLFVTFRSALLIADPKCFRWARPLRTVTRVSTFAE